MVREAGARAGVPRGDRGGRGPGRGRARGGSIAPRAGSRAARVKLEGASSGEEFGAPPGPLPRPCSGLPSFSSRSAGSACLGPQEATAKVPSAFLPLLGPRRFGPARGWGVPGGGAQAAEADRLQLSGRRGFLANPAPLGFLPPERPRPSAGSTARPSRGQKVRGPLGQLSRALPLDSRGRAGPRGPWTAAVTREASVLCEERASPEREPGGTEAGASSSADLARPVPHSSLSSQVFLPHNF